VINRSDTFYMQYKKYVWASFTISMALSALVVFLLALNRRLHKARRSLARLNVSLEAQVEERTAALSQANADLTTEIRERKQAEEKIRASLREKETLLKEVHHRVKNNPQVISSLLDLQSSYLQDEKAGEMFRNSKDRISTMARIHTMLYQSEDMSRVDFGGFIRDLAGRLQQSYGIAGSPIEVHVIETSIPCGLILNELISNALKHAFPEGTGGEVTISMKKVQQSPSHFPHRAREDK
jgi:two-component sensor histidine kinase